MVLQKTSFNNKKKGFRLFPLVWSAQNKSLQIPILVFVAQEDAQFFNGKKISFKSIQLEIWHCDSKEGDGLYNLEE